MGSDKNPAWMPGQRSGLSLHWSASSTAAGEALLQHPLVSAFMRFLLVGGSTAVLHYGVFILLVWALAVDPVPATMVAYSGGAVMNYALNYRYTFRSRRAHRQALGRFAAVASVGFGLNSGIVAVGIHGLGMHYLLAQIIATGIVLLWNFAANLLWSFGNEALQKT